MPCGGLCQRRECLVPTWRGWLLLALLMAALGVGLLLGIYPFLAQMHPCETGPVVVEGWASADALKTAIAEHRKHRTPILYVTGGVLGEDLAGVTHLGSHAELGAARVVALGLPAAEVQAVPALVVRKDRTYANGLALKQWLEGHGGVPPRLTVVSEGPHARRSRMLYQQAFGQSAEVGIIAATDWDRPGERWWTYSQGFRAVTDELIAYLYASLLFWRAGA